jgi:hypothetical protein
MKTHSLRLAVLGAAASLASLAFFVAPATSQVQATPSYTPIGVSAAGNASMAWFHDPSTGRAVACQAVAAAGSGPTGIQCVAARLP